MPFLFRTLLLLVLAALGQLPVMAAPAMIPAPPQIAAKGYILVDASTGNVIVEKNADARLEPASLTKMMTSYVADYELRNGTIHRDDMAQGRGRVVGDTTHPPSDRVVIVGDGDVLHGQHTHTP